jgi:hypothetical protein
MQQFVVPQFIDVEDKIIGPVTTRQFLILLAASLVCGLAFRFADTALFAIILIIIGGSALVIAFVKINGQSFHYFLLNIFQTVKKPSLRVWQKSYTSKELDFLRKLDASIEIEETVVRKKAKQQHIRDLALVVNTGGYYRPIDGITDKPKNNTEALH